MEFKSERVFLSGSYVVLVGYVLGLSLAAPPGPVNAVIMKKTFLTTIS